MGAGDLCVLRDEDGGVEGDGGGFREEGLSFWGGGGAPVGGGTGGCGLLGGHCGLWIGVVWWWIGMARETRLARVELSTNAKARDRNRILDFIFGITTSN